MTFLGQKLSSFQLGLRLRKEIPHRYEKHSSFFLRVLRIGTQLTEIIQGRFFNSAISHFFTAFSESSEANLFLEIIPECSISDSPAHSHPRPRPSHPVCVGPAQGTNNGN